MTTGALQHHFGTRAELVTCVLAERMFPVTSVPELPSLEGRPLAERCEKLVDLLWTGVYGIPAYPALWDVVLACQREPDLRERVLSFQKEAADVSLEYFVAALAGLPLTAQERIDIQVLVCSNLRGLAMFRPYAYDDAFLEAQSRTLARVLQHHLVALVTDRRSDR